MMVNNFLYTFHFWNKSKMEIQLQNLLPTMKIVGLFMVVVLYTFSVKNYVVNKEFMEPEPFLELVNHLKMNVPQLEFMDQLGFDLEQLLEGSKPMIKKCFPCVGQGNENKCLKECFAKLNDLIKFL